MAKIVSFDNRQSLDNTRASVRGQAQSAASSNDEVARSLGQVADAVENQANTYIEEAAVSIAGTEFNRAIQEATISLSKYKTQRYSQTVDRDGNPTYGALVGDIENAGSTILEQVGGKINSERAREMFRTKFSENLTSELVNAGGVMRKQQIQHARAALEESVNALVEVGIMDEPDQVALHEQSIADALDIQLAGGTITPEERTATLRKSVKQIRNGQWERRIESSPESSMNTLINADPSDLGLTYADHKSLKKQAINMVSKMQQAAEKQAEADKEDILNETISKDIVEDSNLGVYSDKEIEGHYTTVVEQLSRQGGGKALSLPQKVLVASQYGRAVKPLTNEIQYTLKSGQNQEAAGVIQALVGAKQDRKSMAILEGLDSDSQAIFAVANTLMSTNAVGADMALQEARKTVFNVDDKVRAERETSYRGIDEFKADELADTVSQMFGTEWGVGWLSVTDEPNHIQEGVVGTMDSLLKTAYLQTGDKDAAIELVKNKYAKNFGVSEINGKEELMFLPLEKAIPDANINNIRANLYESVYQWVPEGTELENLTVQSGELSVYNPNIAAYSVLVNVEGEPPMPLTKENGDQVMWVPDVEMIQQGSMYDRVVEQSVAVAQAEALREQQREGLRPDKFGGLTLGRVFNEVYNFAISTTAGREVVKQAEVEYKELMEAEADLAEAIDVGDGDRLKVAMKRVTKARNDVGKNPALVKRQGLGEVTKKYESRGDKNAYNPTDPDGGSIGQYQMNGNTLDQFLDSYGYNADFGTLEKGSKQWRAVWAGLASDPQFQKDEREFILDRVFKPARTYASRAGVPVSEPVDEAVFSLSIQHGVKGYNSVFNAAAAQNPQTDEDWVRALYTERMKQYPDYKTRYKKEMKDVLRTIRR